MQNIMIQLLCEYRVDKDQNWLQNVLEGSDSI